MRRINFAFAALLALVFAAAAGGFHALHVVQYVRVAESLRWQAERARDDGRTDEAVRYANQYLEFCPDDAAVMTKLTEWLADRFQDTGNWKHRVVCFQLYDKILRLTPDDRVTRRKAAELGILLWRWPEAISHFDILLRGEASAELLERYAYCLVQVRRYDAAAEWYQKAIHTDPQRVSAALSLAALLHSQGHRPRPEEALAVVQRAVQANPTSSKARTGLAQFLRANGRLSEAKDAIEQSRELAKDDDDGAAVFAVAADIALAEGRFDQSRALLEQGCAKYPKDSRLVRALAWQLLYEGHADLALARLRVGQAANPKDIDILTLLGDLLAQDGQVGPLEDTLRELTERNAPSDRVHYVQARLAMRRGRFAEAVALFDQLRMSTPRNPNLYRQANLLLAQCHEQLNDANAELEAYRRVLEHDPSAAGVRLDYVRALARHGQFDDAWTQFLPVVQKPEVSSRGVVETARLLIDQFGRDPKAGAELAKMIDALTIDDVNPNTALTRAALDLSRQRPADSLPAIERLLKRLSNNIALHTMHAALTEQVFGLDQALGVLAAAEAAYGDIADFRVVRARMLGARLDRADADALAHLTRGLERFNAADRLRVLSEVIAAERGIGAFAAVAQHFELLARLRPDYLPAREALYLIALRSGDDMRRQAALHEVEAVEGKDGSTAHLLAAVHLLWLATAGDGTGLANAAARLDAAAKLRPGDPVVEFLYGRVEEIAGRADQALKLYQKAFDHGLADRPVAELFATLAGKSNSAPVAVLRDRLPLANRLRPDRDRELVVAALPLYDAAGHEALATRVAANSPPDDAVQQIWLGRQFARLGLTAQAEQAFRRAAAAAPQSSEGWQALVTDRAARRDADGVKAVVDEITQKLSPVEAYLVIGRAFESAHEYDRAKEEYRAALTGNRNDTRPLKALANLAARQGQPDQACEWLEALGRLSNPSVPEDARWARRTLAVHLATTPSKEAFQKALEILKGNETGGTLTEDDQRARVLVLAAQKNRPLPGGRTARQEAIRSLEQLRQVALSRMADDLLLLAQLYRAENDDLKARAACEQMRTEFPNHFGCTAYLAREALRAGDLTACEKVLPVLWRLGPGQFEPLAIEFQYRVLAGDAALARKLLDDYVAAAGSDETRVQRSLQSANLVSGFLQIHPLKNRPEAAADLRAAAVRLFQAQRLPDAPTFQAMKAAERRQVIETFQQLVTLLAGQPADGANRALALIQERRGVFGPEVSAAAYIQVQRLGVLTKGHTATVQQFLLDAFGQLPQSTALLMSLADFYSQADEPGRAKAVSYYRKILASEPDNVAALNNLAWTLSQDGKDPMKAREALMSVERAIDLAGPLDELLDTRAHILFEGGQQEEGLRDMGEAVRAAPSASRWGDYATLLRRAGQIEAARHALAQAARFGLDEGQR